MAQLYDKSAPDTPQHPARLPNVTSAGRRKRNLSAATKRTSKIAFDVLSGKGV